MGNVGGRVFYKDEDCMELNKMISASSAGFFPSILTTFDGSPLTEYFELVIFYYLINSHNCSMTGRFFSFNLIMCLDACVCIM